MRSLFIYLVLILHVNTTMFFPVMEETIRYDAKGKPVDDVTSILEFINQIVLEHQDKTPSDKEEDHREHFFNAFKCAFYIIEQKIHYDRTIEPEPESSIQYSELQQNAVSLVSYDILTPPPKA